MTSKYAQISDGKVQNIAVFETREDAIRITHAIYGNESDAINVDYIDVRFGGTYRYGKFYNIDENESEVEAEQIPTESQRISELEAQNAQLITVLADLIGGATNE